MEIPWSRPRISWYLKKNEKWRKKKEKKKRKENGFVSPLSPFCPPTVSGASGDDRQDRDRIGPGELFLSSLQSPLPTAAPSTQEAVSDPPEQEQCHSVWGHIRWHLARVERCSFCIFILCRAMKHQKHDLNPNKPAVLSALESDCHKVGKPRGRNIQRRGFRHGPQRLYSCQNNCEDIKEDLSQRKSRG